MPSLQLDVVADLDPDDKRALAAALGAAYSRVMGSDPALMTVVVRTLAEGTVWHGGEDPVPGALLMCDVRAGRDQATRHALCALLVEIVAAHCGVPEHHVKVELTQHTGDEMFHPHLGGFNRDWDASEAGGPGS